MFKGACNCGAEFEVDIKNDRVEEADSTPKMKELNQYNKNRSEDAYGREQGESSDYNNKPAKRPAISYNTNSRQGMTYKN